MQVVGDALQGGRDTGELGHGLSCVLLQRHLVSDCRKSRSPGPGVSECSRITLGWVLGLQLPEVVEPHLCNRAPVLNKLPRSVPRNSDCKYTDWFCRGGREFPVRRGQGRWAKQD